MPIQRTPKSLYDVSHLFLSKREIPSSRSRSVEAAIWLVRIGSSFNRAFFASGCANAVAAKGLFVTLVEVGAGLPNIGYYYSLDPIEYASLSVDDYRLVTGFRPPYTRFASAVRTVEMNRYAPPILPDGSTHILLIAFDHTKGGDMEGRRSEIERIGGKVLRGHGGFPDALVVCDEGSEPVEVRRFLADARMVYPGTPVFRVTSRLGEDKPFGADESIPMPAGLKRAWSSRSAPAAPFFDGLVSNLLQVLSHRRRKAVRDVLG
jgi:hypothetical protein